MRANRTPFLYVRKQAPAWFSALSAADRRCGPFRCQGRREVQSVLGCFQDTLAAACRILVTGLRRVHAA
jgi:hypothetical protein